MVCTKSKLFISLFFTLLASTAAAKSSMEAGEGLSVLVLGSGGPVASAAGRASASYLIFTDGKPRILMDAGGGSFQRLAQSGVNIKDLDLVLLSHLHIDHSSDLSAFIKSIYFHNTLNGQARTRPVKIYGPAANGIPFPNTDIPQYPGTEEYAHKHYDLPDGTERYLNIFASAISKGASRFAYEAYDLKSVVNNAGIETFIQTDDGLKVSSIAVDHGPVPALAFRVEYKGKSLVYSGDTASRGMNMQRIAEKADLLIYDTAIMDDLPANPVFHVLHTSPTRMAEVARHAKVKMLLLSHITPVTESNMPSLQQQLRKQGYQGKLQAASDLLLLDLTDL